MPKEAEYDVFISCKSEDYAYAEEIYEFLKQNDIYAFLASKDLRKLGDTEYIEEIGVALESSYHLLVLSSSEANLNSKFVKKEWKTFLNEVLSGRKSGQIMTFLIGMTVSELPVLLREYETFTRDDYKEKILKYVQSPASLRRQEEARIKAEQEEKARIALEKEARRKELLKIEIKELEYDYKRFTDNLNSLSENIISKRLELGDDSKQCPVCEKVNHLRNHYCDRCGWTFEPPFDVSPKADKDHLFVVKSVWDGMNKPRVDEKKIDDLLNQITVLKRTADTLASEKAELEKENKASGGKIELISRQLRQSENDKSESRKAINALENSIRELKGRIAEKDDAIIQLNKQCSDLNVELAKYREERRRKVAEEKHLAAEAAERQARAKRYADAFNGHEYVDLGLPSGLLWASCNVGANSPEEYGSYFAWGETSPKKDYSWSTLKYCNDNTGDSFSKYNKDQAGTKDNKTELEPLDDAAHANWGGGWRMPARKDWEELFNKQNCSRGWDNKRQGWVVKSEKNGNSIFLPAAGFRSGESSYSVGEYGYYWSSSLLDDYSGYACCCRFNFGVVYPSDWSNRCNGFSVRPVAAPLSPQ